MRARDLLLEYQRQETEARFGEKLVQRFITDTSNYAKRCLEMLKRKMLSPSQFPTKESRYAYILNWMMQEIEDCVEVEKFIPWVVNIYCRQGFLWEDLSRSGVYTRQYNDLRQSGYFKRNPEANAEFGDINRFRTLSDLGAFLMKITAEDSTSNAERDRQLEQTMIDEGDAVIYHDDATWKIVIPYSQEASCHFGRNTQWCTAATNSDNMFENYNEGGPLYIILNKPANRRWQLHMQSRQFMNENDQEVSLTEIETLLTSGVLDEAIAFAERQGAFNVMTMTGFPVRIIRGIIREKMPKDAQARLAIKSWSERRHRRFSPAMAEIDTVLAEFTYPKSRVQQTSRADVKCRVFETPDDLFLYAYKNGDIQCLHDVDFGSFNYENLAHFEEAKNYLSGGCVFYNDTKRIYYANFAAYDESGLLDHGAHMFANNCGIVDDVIEWAVANGDIDDNVVKLSAVAENLVMAVVDYVNK